MLLVKSKVTINNINTTSTTSISSTSSNQPKAKKHCDTCEKHRPLARISRQLFLYQTHNTANCFKEHGAKFKKQAGNVKPSTSHPKNDKNGGNINSKKRDNAKAKATDGKGNGGSGKGANRRVVQAKRIKAEAKVNSDNEADDEENGEDGDDDEAEEGDFTTDRASDYESE